MIIHFCTYSISSCANSGTKWWRQHISTCRLFSRFCVSSTNSIRKPRAQELTELEVTLLSVGAETDGLIRNNKNTSYFEWMGNRKCKTTRTREFRKLNNGGETRRDETSRLPNRLNNVLIMSIVSIVSVIRSLNSFESKNYPPPCSNRSRMGCAGKQKGICWICESFLLTHWRAVDREEHPLRKV